MVRPLQELKAFERVTLSPGEQKTLTFTLPVDMLNFTSYEGQRIVEPGEFELQIGNSSADIRGRVTVQVTGETRTLPSDWRMMSHCDVK
jgi:beta-glucosidase